MALTLKPWQQFVEQIEQKSASIQQGTETGIYSDFFCVVPEGHILEINMGANIGPEYRGDHHAHLWFTQIRTMPNGQKSAVMGYLDDERHVGTSIVRAYNKRIASTLDGYHDLINREMMPDLASEHVYHRVVLEDDISLHPALVFWQIDPEKNSRQRLDTNKTLEKLPTMRNVIEQSIPLLKPWAALRYDRNDVLQAGLDRGISPNAVNRFGESLLTQATLFNATGCIDTLVNAGANTNIKRPGCGDTPLMTAIDQGNTSLACYFIDCAKININQANYEGFNPLTLACLRENPTCVRALLAHPDINPCHTTRNGQSASDFTRHPEISSSLQTATETWQARQVITKSVEQWRDNPFRVGRVDTTPNHRLL